MDTSQYDYDVFGTILFNKSTNIWLDYELYSMYIKYLHLYLSKGKKYSKIREKKNCLFLKTNQSLRTDILEFKQWEVLVYS